MNNAVYNGRGECVGYRCFTCNKVFQSMWDCTCNGCRKKEEMHREQIKAIKELTDALNKAKEL